MADYYTNFSVVLPLTKQQQDFAFEIAKQDEEQRTQELPTDFQAKRKHNFNTDSFCCTKFGKRADAFDNTISLP